MMAKVESHLRCGSDSVETSAFARHCVSWKVTFRGDVVVVIGEVHGDVVDSDGNVTCSAHMTAATSDEYHGMGRRNGELIPAMFRIF